MSNPQYKNRLKALKKLGVVDYDLRKNLSASQKRNITLKYEQYKSILIHSENYAIKSVNKKLGNEFKESGYKTISKKGGAKIKVIIPKTPEATVTIKRGKAIVESPTRIYEIYPNTKKDFFKKLDELKDLKFNKNQYLTGQIMGNRPFKRKFLNTAQLLHYVTTTFKPDLISHMTVVTVKNTIVEKKPNAKKKGNKRSSRN